MKTLYIDIETIPGDIAPTIDQVKIPGTMKKQETIDAWWKKEKKAIHHKQSLNSMKGQILCTGIAVDDDTPIVFTDIKGFDEFVFGINEEVQWVGHNISTFDAKWLVRHGVRLGLDYTQRFKLDRYRGNIRDTMTMWACGDYKDYTKLDDLAKFLGVGRKTEGIDGSQVWQYYKDGRIDEIKAYCADDVELTRAVFKKMRGYIL